MKKKFLVLLIWIIIINILINIFYYLIMENGINILIPQLAFKIKYYFREVIEVAVDYNDLNKNNVVSKNNIAIRLSSINYEQTSGELNLKFEFYTNNDDILENIGSVLRIYDNKKIFYHGYGGATIWDSDTAMNLLLGKNMYGKFDESNLYNKKLFGELDDTNFNFGFCTTITGLDNDDEPVTEEVTLNLGKKYEISDNLYIDFLDFQYKSVDEFIWRKAIEPFGEFKFIVNF